MLAILAPFVGMGSMMEKRGAKPAGEVRDKAYQHLEPGCRRRPWIRRSASISVSGFRPTSRFPVYAAGESSRWQSRRASLKGHLSKG